MDVHLYVVLAAHKHAAVRVFTKELGMSVAWVMRNAVLDLVIQQTENGVGESLMRNLKQSVP